MLTFSENRALVSEHTTAQFGGIAHTYFESKQARHWLFRDDKGLLTLWSNNRRYVIEDGAGVVCTYTGKIYARDTTYGPRYKAFWYGVPKYVAREVECAARESEYVLRWARKMTYSLYNTETQDEEYALILAQTLNPEARAKIARECQRSDERREAARRA